MNLAQIPQRPTCYVSPKRGIAFFDGITIYADHITDIRENSVFPVMEEKQICMCRQMKKLLLSKEKSSIVLDVGTGSGVYAIYAASLCNCKVIAIDISARALRIAKQNAKKNHIPIVENLKELKPGSIYFIQSKFGDKFIQKMEKLFSFDAKEVFDFVLLSPPNMINSPDISAISIPKHANAGKDGQEPFLEQIKYVPGVLKSGGYCLGIQMTPVDNDDIPKAVKDIDKAFNNNCQTTIKKLFNTDLPTRDLLKGQYRSFLNHVSEDKYLVNEIGDYISEITKLHPKITQIYYETIKKENVIVKDRHFFVPYKANEVGHRRDWKDRIWVYRKIVDYSSRKGYFPTPSIFTKDFAGNLIAAKNSYNRRNSKNISNPDNKIRKNTRRNIQSPLEVLDSRIKRHSAQNELNFLFDMILIEIVPVFTVKDIDSGKYKNIKQECKVWISDRNKEKLPRNKIQETAKKILQAWKIHTKAQQRARLGTFFHPDFIGTVSPDQWGQAYQSTLSPDIDISFEREDYKILNKYCKRIEKNYIDKIDNLSSDQEIEFYNDNEYSNSDSIFTLSNLISLNQLEVPGFKEYCEGLIKIEGKNTRIPFLKDQKYTNLQEQIQTNKNNVINFLMGRSKIEENRELWNELLEKDAHFCHRAWHKYITSYFKNIAKEETLSPQCGFSTLISLPIFIQNISGSLDDSTKALESYRGGIWIYAASSDHWTLEHEEYLKVLARLTLLLCIEQYALVAPDISEDEGEEYRSKLLGHEVKHVASAMSHNWVRPITDFFEIFEYSSPKPSSNKIGRIEIWDERFLQEPWKKNLAFTPFRDLIASAGQLINFWCLLHNPADVPFSEESPPEDLESFVGECWDWAVDTVIMHALSRENPSTPERVIELQKIREAIKKIHDFPILDLDRADFPRITWNVKADSSSKTVWLCRFMVALFTNCVKHSDPTQRIKISIGCTSKKDSLYWIEIDDYKSLGDETNRLIREKIVAQNRSQQEIAEEACEYLEKAKYKLEYLDSKLNLSTREVVDTCLNNLKPESNIERESPLFCWSDKVLQPGEHFFVKIPFNYPEG